VEGGKADVRQRGARVNIDVPRYSGQLGRYEIGESRGREVVAASAVLEGNGADVELLVDIRQF
jgi:hypothetical protein